MEGRPVWLASVACRDGRGELVATGDWPADARTRADEILTRLLAGVGDESREVVFRMNITLCRHRGLTDEEEASLGADFHDAPATDTAGCSVETIWRKGVDSPASLPCENPGRVVADRSRPDLWLPEPCGVCGPCIDRERVRVKVAG